MLQQYLDIKEQYKDAVLFYRMGDFYEMFFEDAILASRVLGITLTSRSKKDDENKIPMCGIPFHALTGYLGKMIKAGHRVALCEQVEDPSQTKTIVKREVVRVVTPGVTTDTDILDEKANRYVCSLLLTATSKKNQTMGMSFLDVSTGDFFITEEPFNSNNHDPIINEVTRMAPAELLVTETDQEQQKKLIATLATLLPGLCVTARSEMHFDPDIAHTALTEHFQVSNLAGFGIEGLESGICAAGGLLAYIQDTQKTGISHINKLRQIKQHDYLIIDESSRRNLELTETIIGGKRTGSLLAVLDFTNTPMGARLLRQRVLFPLQQVDTIQHRLDAVETLINNKKIHQDFAEALNNVYDLERLCSRLVLGHGNARDMHALKVSLSRLPRLKELAGSTTPGLLQNIGEGLDNLADLHELLEGSIREDAPVSLREGKLIKEKYHAELDELITLDRDGKQMILHLESKERKRSGISKLKVGFNRVFGYYFEVSRAQAEQVPDDFIRKQTLVNAERFLSPELKELENKISTAMEKRLELEYTLFSEIRDRVAGESERILNVAHQVARIDFLCSLAEAARRYNYTKPGINTGEEITIREGRHPVIERSLEPGRFVPNDVYLNQHDNELLLITGPNMAGKSTVLRQTALIVLMAHLGSFVPAEESDICLVDRIFTRVGAMDDLRRGQSTFMVEMNETANILNNATEKSLVILDEIGRGTSTYDGLAIAWAVAEDLAEKNNKGVKTLFATHYHELTELASDNPRIQNYSIAVREWNDTIIFLHKFIKGATNRSYGIQVAGLAGVPDNVVKRAHEILRDIEATEHKHSAKQKNKATGTPKKKKSQPCQLSLFAPRDDGLKDLLREYQPDATTPRQALELLYKAHEIINNNN